MLHWANKDQYYIKSGENFSNYTFKLDDGRKVHFRLVAADTAKDNRKDNDKDRRFALAKSKTIMRTDENGEDYEETITPIEGLEIQENGQSTTELVLRFEYIPVDKSTKQETLIVQALERVFADDVPFIHAQLRAQYKTFIFPFRINLEIKKGIAKIEYKIGAKHILILTTRY